MDKNGKIIRDPIHGDIKFNELFQEIIKTPEIQRLYNIKQLGFTHLVFPGAHHTRLEHSLGSYFLSLKAANQLNLDDYETNILCCAAILHDIGHGPFSHTLESLLRESLSIDHVDLTEKLITGDHEIFFTEEKEFLQSKTIFDVLNKYQINQQEIIEIIRGQKKILGQLVNSSIDVDQLDYLIRDAYYTGVSYGIIDIDRFLQTLMVLKDNLAVKRKGVGVVENILMARTLMYSSVYFHKTVRIAELMFSKSIELAKGSDAFELYKMTDGEILNQLKKLGPYQKEISVRLKYRNLFKKALSFSQTEIDPSQIEIIKKLDNIKNRNDKEREMESILNIPEGKIIIDVPYSEIHLSEPRLDKTDILILDNNEAKPFDDYTPIGGAVRTKNIPDWIIMIITPDKYRDLVSKKAVKILFN